MAKNDFIPLAVPILPRAKYVGRGYYTSAYYVLEPTNVSKFEDDTIQNPSQEFDPEEEPDYFLEFGYPEPKPKPKPAQDDVSTIVLCHGLAANGLLFVDDAHYFANNGYRVIVPDLRGHGRSKMPTKNLRSSDDFTFEKMADDLLAILDKEQIEKTHWVGHSLGGLMALTIMESHPNRLGDVVFFGTSFSLNMPAFSLSLLKMVDKLLKREHKNQLVARLGANKVEAQAIIYQMLKQADKDCINSIMRYLSNYDLINNIHYLEGALLLMRGSKDFLINQAQSKTLAEMEQHPLFFRKDIKNASHFTNLDQPEVFRNVILDFISGGWIYEESQIL